MIKNQQLSTHLRNRICANRDILVYSCWGEL